MAKKRRQETDNDQDLIERLLSGGSLENGIIVKRSIEFAKEATWTETSLDGGGEKRMEARESGGIMRRK